MKQATCIMVLTVIGGLTYLSVAAEVDEGSLKEKFRGQLISSLEFKDGYNAMTANPQLARKVVREELGRAPTGQILIRCLDLLKAIGEKDDAMYVLPLLYCAQDVSIRFMATEVVSKWGDHRTLGVMEMLLYDENPDIRAIAIQFFEKQKTKWSAEALRRFLEFQPKNDEMKKDQDRVREILKKAEPAKK